MERETRELKIGGHTVIAKTYATARETNLIQQALFKGSKVSIVGDQPKMDDFNPSATFEMECELIRQMVVMVDGQADFIAAVEAFPVEQWRELVAAIDNGIVSKKKS